MSLHLSNCQIVGNRMHWLNYVSPLMSISDVAVVVPSVFRVAFGNKFSGIEIIDNILSHNLGKMRTISRHWHGDIAITFRRLLKNKQLSKRFLYLGRN